MAEVSSLIAEIKEIAAMSEQNRRTMWMESHKVGGKTLNELYREDLQKKADSIIAKAESFEMDDIMEGKFNDDINIYGKINFRIISNIRDYIYYDNTDWKDAILGEMLLSGAREI